MCIGVGGGGWGWRVQGCGGWWAVVHGRRRLACTPNSASVSMASLNCVPAPVAAAARPPTLCCSACCRTPDGCSYCSCLTGGGWAGMGGSSVSACCMATPASWIGSSCCCSSAAFALAASHSRCVVDSAATAVLPAAWLHRAHAVWLPAAPPAVLPAARPHRTPAAALQQCLPDLAASSPQAPVACGMGGAHATRDVAINL